MDGDRELLHKLLDGELPPEEAAALMERMNAEPLLREEFDLLGRAVSLLENSGRKAAPLSFTPEVMRALPEGTKESLPRTSRGRLPSRNDWKGFRDFFFRERMVRWNMAAALATVFLAVVILGGVLSYRKDMQSPYSNSSGSAVTARFKFYSPDAKRVSIAGDFNKWNIDEGTMKRRGKGTWTIEIPLTPGAYNYMFVVDGDVWVTDPEAEAYRDDGFGYKNSVVRVNSL